jgi:hypothetical protein
MRRELCNVNGIQFSIRYTKQQRGKYPGGGYMALELFFVSARTNKRHHHHPNSRRKHQPGEASVTAFEDDKL